ncbi:hypothetical protein JW766_05435 [Candidatus Dojkabacteria bacterium]|nr:hypothetical protein [Candidatus Dojkabacteria bacterium]
MKTKRFLIIKFDKFTLYFLLIQLQGEKLKILASKKMRIYRHGFKYLMADYILTALTLWGKKIGVALVKEMVPLIPQVGSDGVTDIFIFTYKKEQSLNSLTKNIFVMNKDIKKTGASSVTKFFDFKNILFVHLGSESTDVVRYIRGSQTSMKVVAEKKNFLFNKLIENFPKELKSQNFPIMFNESEFLDILRNISRIPAFDLKSIEGVYVEYLINYLRLGSFVNCQKLKLESFGQGEPDENALIISGDRVKITNNIPLEVLSIVNVFNLRGHFNIYVDKYGFFDLLQKSGKQILKDMVYTELALNFWGKFITVSAKSGTKLDEVVADVDVIDGDTQKRFIPLYGRILTFSFRDEGEMNIISRDRFIFSQGEKELKYKNLSKNFVIDARERPVSKAFERYNSIEVLKMWFTGVGAIR